MAKNGKFTISKSKSSRLLCDLIAERQEVDNLESSVVVQELDLQ